MMTIDWESGRSGEGRPTLQVKGSGFYWQPRVRPFGPDQRLLTVSPLGAIMHELMGHVGQDVLPELDDLFTLEEKRRWSYAQNAGGWQLEGGPTIWGFAYGGQFDRLPHALQTKLRAVALLSDRIPADWQRTPDRPDHIPQTPLETPPEPPAKVKYPGHTTIVVRNRLLAAISRLTAGEVMVSLQQLVEGGLVGGAFAEAPVEIRRAIGQAFPPEEWENAAQVSRAESNWNPDAHAHDSLIIQYRPKLAVRPRPRHPDGSWADEQIPPGWKIAREDSRGLFQINVDVHRTWLARKDISGDGLFDPRRNARQARRIFENAKRQPHGNGWYPWTWARIHGIQSV